MKHLVLPMLVLGMLAGCGTTSNQQAVIEDRSMVKPAAPAATSQTATTGLGSQAVTTGVGDRAVTASVDDRTIIAGVDDQTVIAGVDDQTVIAGVGDRAVTTGAGDRADTGKTIPIDPRKDPANLLSRRSVYFDFDQFVIKDEYRPLIEAHASYLNGHRNARVTIEGHADERGSREYNLALGQKRAEAVKKVLAFLGVQESQMEAISFGEEKPRRLGNTEADYAENRRADIVYGDE